MNASARPTISFTVPGIPVQWSRAGKHGGIQFTPTPQRNFMAAVKTICAAAMKGMPPLEGPLELAMRASYTHPPSWSAKLQARTRWKVTRPDNSNLVKIVEDALNGVAYRDDAQIASLHVWKVFGPRAELVVEIRGLE